MALTARQERFVAEYLIDLNATQAAIRAGYSEKTAEQQGPRLLGYVGVANAIAAAKAKRAKKTEITQERVLAELAKIGFADIRKAVRWGSDPGDLGSDNADQNGLGVYPVSLVPSDEVDDDTAAAITEVSLTAQGVKIKMADKRAALESLLKHLGGLPSDDDAPSVNVRIDVAPAVGDVRVTKPDG